MVCYSVVRVIHCLSPVRKKRTFSFVSSCDEGVTTVFDSFDHCSVLYCVEHKKVINGELSDSIFSPSLLD